MLVVVLASLLLLSSLSSLPAVLLEEKTLLRNATSTIVHSLKTLDANVMGKILDTLIKAWAQPDLTDLNYFSNGVDRSKRFMRL